MGAAPLILVADHEPACRDRITRLLRRIGLETASDVTGQETLEAGLGHPCGRAPTSAFPT